VAEDTVAEPAPAAAADPAQAAEEPGWHWGQAGWRWGYSNEGPAAEKKAEEVATSSHAETYGSTAASYDPQEGYGGVQSQAQTTRYDQYGQPDQSAYVDPVKKKSRWGAQVEEADIPASIAPASSQPDISSILQQANKLGFQLPNTAAPPPPPLTASMVKAEAAAYDQYSQYSQPPPSLVAADPYGSLQESAKPRGGAGLAARYGMVGAAGDVTMSIPSAQEKALASQMGLAHGMAQVGRDGLLGANPHVVMPGAQMAPRALLGALPHGMPGIGVAQMPPGMVMRGMPMGGTPRFTAGGPRMYRPRY
jgi:hypothetical protein